MHHLSKTEQEVMQQALLACVKLIHEGSKPLDPYFAKVVDEEFWNILRKGDKNEKD